MKRILIVISIFVLALSINLVYADVTTISFEPFLQIRMKKGTLRGEYNDCFYYKLTDSQYTWLRTQLGLTLPGIRTDAQARVDSWIESLQTQAKAIRATRAQLLEQKKALQDMIASVDAEYATAPEA